ncbi:MULTISPECIES: bacteriocin immunity protein [unclassified Pseudomonas]|uniref:bacteriocin immunity protein n=1 Tax=unclassified Pseudomonas TaxID=196821 RepID=UPI00211426E8|nr:MULTISPECIES: bacteriocin immunity protein [unclassified Pseudomonas]
MTESEFLAFVIKIFESQHDSENEQTEAVLEFIRITEHPYKADLIYYPEAGKDNPEAVVNEIKNWRAANGKPGFKQS